MEGDLKDTEVWRGTTSLCAGTGDPYGLRQYGGLLHSQENMPAIDEMPAQSSNPILMLYGELAKLLAALRPNQRRLKTLVGWPRASLLTCAGH